MRRGGLPGRGGYNSPPGPLGGRSPKRPLPQNPVELHFGADVQCVRVGLLQGRRWRHGIGLRCEHRVSKTLPWPGPLPSWDWKGQGRQWEAVGTASAGSWGRRRGAYSLPAEGRGKLSQRLRRSSRAPPAGRELRGEGCSAAGSQHHPPSSPPVWQPRFWWPGLARSGR